MMEMISQIDGIAIAVIAFTSLLTCQYVLIWWRNRPRGFKEGGFVRSLNELIIRDAVQAFLDLNHIGGNANIRDGRIHSAPTPPQFASYARVLRAEYNRIIDTHSLNAEHYFLGVIGVANNAIINISVNDLIAIADLLEGTEK